MHRFLFIAVAASCFGAGASAHGQFAPPPDAPVAPAGYAGFPVDAGRTTAETKVVTGPEEDAGGKEHLAKPLANAAAPLALSPPSDENREAPQSPTSGGALFTVLGSLAVVIALFLLVVWLTRRALPKAAGALPSEVVDVLGRAPLAPRQSLTVVRFGNKLLLVSQTPQGMTTVGEIGDPDEVDRLSGLCRQGRPDSVTATFRQVLTQMGRERPRSSDETARAA